MKRSADYHHLDMDYQEKLLNTLLQWAPQDVRNLAQYRMRKRLFREAGLLNKYTGRGELRK